MKYSSLSIKTLLSTTYELLKRTSMQWKESSRIELLQADLQARMMPLTHRHTGIIWNDRVVKQNETKNKIEICFFMLEQRSSFPQEWADPASTSLSKELFTVEPSISTFADKKTCSDHILFKKWREFFSPTPNRKCLRS